MQWRIWILELVWFWKEILRGLVEVGRAFRGDVIRRNVGAGADGRVLRGAVLLQRISAVAREVWMVYRLDWVPPPAALDAFGLLVLEKPWVGAGRATIRFTLGRGAEYTNPA